jgi:hypothetical protein
LGILCKGENALIPERIVQLFPRFAIAVMQHSCDCHKFSKQLVNFSIFVCLLIICIWSSISWLFRVAIFNSIIKVRNILLKYSNWSKMTTGTQTQTAWAPWIRELVDTLETLCWGKAQAKADTLASWTPSPWKPSPCHNTLKVQVDHHSHTATTCPTASPPVHQPGGPPGHCLQPTGPLATSSKHAWETFSRPNRILSSWTHTWQNKNLKRRNETPKHWASSL